MEKSEESLKAKARSISIQEGSAYSISEGIGMRYIVPYAIALGANNNQIGLLSSLPQFLASFSQIYALKLMPKFSRKKIAFYGALLQAIMWLVIIAIGIIPFILKINTQQTSNLLILLYTLLIIFGTSIAPVWSSWMKDIVPEKTFGYYFGIRNRIMGFSVLISMLIGGFILDYFKQTKLFIGFIIIFSIAFLSRLISSILFLKKYEPEFQLDVKAYFTLFQFLNRMPKTNFGRFVIYDTLMVFATYLAAPFFTVYMLKDLQLSYVTYIIIIMGGTFASLLFMPVWGRFADKYGNKKVLQITGFLVPFIPILWLASPLLQKHAPSLLVPYLIILELFGGFAWAGFSLSSTNFVYSAVSKPKLALGVAYFHIMENTGLLVGAIIGGFITNIPHEVLKMSAILFVFLLSGIGRFIVSLIILPQIQEVQHVKKFGVNEAKQIISHLSPSEIFRILR